VVTVNWHIPDEQRMFDPPCSRAGVMQHFVQCYTRSVLITQNYHAYGVAHEDDVDATLIEQTRRRVIVRRERGNFLAAPLHLAKIFHIRLVGRSAADVRTQAGGKSGAAAPHSKTQAPDVPTKFRPRFGLRRCSAALDLSTLPVFRKTNQVARFIEVQEQVAD